MSENANGAESSNPGGVLEIRGDQPTRHWLCSNGTARVGEGHRGVTEIVRSLESTFSTTTAVPRRWSPGDGSRSAGSTGVAWKQLQEHASIFALD